MRGKTTGFSWMFVLAVTGAMLSGAAAATPTSDGVPCGGESAVLHDRALDRIHVVYTLQIDKDDNLVCIRVENRGKIPASAAYSLLTDEVFVDSNHWNLSTGESITTTHNFTNWMDVTKEVHTVSMGTYGGPHKFTFTRNINASAPGGVPSPYISDISVLRYEGNNSAVLQVLVENRGNQSYGIELRTETVETKSKTAITRKQKNGTLLHRISLNEGAGETVAGNIEIFYAWNDSSGLFDRKEFVARPEKQVVVWDKPFREAPSRVERSYYENESARTVGDPEPTRLPYPLGVAGALLLVLVPIGVLAWRYKRKYSYSNR